MVFNLNNYLPTYTLERGLSKYFRYVTNPEFAVTLSLYENNYVDWILI